MPNLEELGDQVSAFINTYKILSPEAKAAFEAQLDKSTVGRDEKTRLLYQALSQAAKDGLTAEEAIEKLSQVSKTPLPPLTENK